MAKAAGKVAGRRIIEAPEVYARARTARDWAWLANTKRLMAESERRRRPVVVRMLFKRCNFF